MANLPNSVGDWNPKMPSGSIESMLEPNAKDNPDSINATNEQAPAKGKGGKMADPAPRGKEF